MPIRGPNSMPFDNRCRFKTQTEARSAVFAFIEGFYNPRRLSWTPKMRQLAKVEPCP